MEPRRFSTLNLGEAVPLLQTDENEALSLRLTPLGPYPGSLVTPTLSLPERQRARVRGGWDRKALPITGSRGRQPLGDRPPSEVTSNRRFMLLPPV